MPKSKNLLQGPTSKPMLPNLLHPTSPSASLFHSGPMRASRATRPLPSKAFPYGSTPAGMLAHLPAPCGFPMQTGTRERQQSPRCQSLAHLPSLRPSRWNQPTFAHTRFQQAFLTRTGLSPSPLSHRPDSPSCTTISGSRTQSHARLGHASVTPCKRQTAHHPLAHSPIQ